MIEQLVANFHGGSRLVFWLLIPFFIAGVFLAIWRSRRTEDRLRVRAAVARSALDVAIAWTVVAMLVVAFYGYGEAAASGDRVQLVPLQEFFGDQPTAISWLLFGNVLLYVPIGLFVALRVPRWSVLQITIGAAAASLLVEIAQFIADDGRVASVDDVLLNTLGGLIGALIARGIMHLAGSWNTPTMNA